MEEKSKTNRYRFSNRKLESSSNILDKTLKRVRLKKQSDKYSAFPLWKEIVGEQISEISFPEKISRERVLVVRVIDSVWAQELSLQKETIVDKIHKTNTGASIEDIRFVAGNPKDFRANR